MPRDLTGTWIPSRGVWVASLGERYDYHTPDGRTISKRRQVVLTYEDGATPVKKDDVAGRLAALARLKAICEAEDVASHGPGLSTAGLFKQWVDWHRRHSRPTTAADYAFVARRACNVPWKDRTIGHVPAREFNVEHLFAIRARLRAEGVADGGIQPLDSHVKAAFRWAAKAVEGRTPLVLLAVNPFPRDSVKGLSPPRSGRPCPTWPELLEILDRLDAHVSREITGGYTGRSRARALANALAVRVIAERGARPREVCELEVGDWDDAAGGFAFGGRHKTAKRGVVGVLPLRGSTAERVRAYLEMDRAGPYVFWPERTEGQGPPDPGHLANWWRSVKGAAGAERYSLYSFRNCVSNRLRLAGVEGRAMQVALRQTSAIADTIYRRDAIEEAARIFRDAGLD
jgi:integrase